mmetsp:Transcript_24325/g.56058  ORF Transcript_24325/g.56058 Transcript_24325/m.56058 type:complete len:393 (+) Transcript_24325:3925-5103(+)
MLLERRPVATALAEEHGDRRQHLVHRSRRAREILDLGDLALCQLVDLLHGFLEGGHRHVQVGLGVGGDLSNLFSLLSNAHLVGLDRLLLLVGVAPLAHDHDQQLFAVLLRLRHDDLLLLQLAAHHLDLLARLLELRETVGELVGRVAQLAALLVVELGVALDQLEELGRRDVVIALEFLEHAVGGALGRQVDDREDLGHVLAHGVIGQRHRREELLADGREGVGGPCVEPVDRGAVDQAGVEAAARAERLADRRHGEHDVQVRAHALDEEAPEVVRRLLKAELGGGLAEAIEDLGELVLTEEVGDLARTEHVVHVLEEALVLDLRVVEEEGRGLTVHTRLDVEPLHVVVELHHAVLLGDGDLEEPELADEGREPRERLAARTAHADEHGVPA